MRSIEVRYRVVQQIGDCIFWAYANMICLDICWLDDEYSCARSKITLSFFFLSLSLSLSFPAYTYYICAVYMFLSAKGTSLTSVSFHVVSRLSLHTDDFFFSFLFFFFFFSLTLFFPLASFPFCLFAQSFHSCIYPLLRFSFLCTFLLFFRIFFLYTVHWYC